MGFLVVVLLTVFLLYPDEIGFESIAVDFLRKIDSTVIRTVRELISVARDIFFLSRQNITNVTLGNYRQHAQIKARGLKALTSFFRVRLLRLRNIFLTVDEREEWLGDLKESVNHMRYVERRSKWYIRRYVFDQHIRLGWSKLQILVFRMVSRIIRG